MLKRWENISISMQRLQHRHLNLLEGVDSMWRTNELLFRVSKCLDFLRRRLDKLRWKLEGRFPYPPIKTDWADHQ